MAVRQPPSIDAYGGGGFRVGGERIEGSVLIVQDAARPWPVGGIAELTPSHFHDVLAANRGSVELVLVGTGRETTIAPRTVREALREAGLGLEVMNTPEACRLYNLLAGEGRRLAAGLIAV
jgi:uncharacterized protein